MEPTRSGSCTAFAGAVRIASGDVARVAEECRRYADTPDAPPVLVLDDATAEPVELDLRGSVADVAARYAPAGTPVRRPPGRPKLGVVGREVTLLPRHWEWLAAQRGGASVALRKLVEHASRESVGADRIRLAQEAAFRAMTVLAGNEPGFEEASRALFAGDAGRFDERTEAWPSDVRDYVRAMVAGAFGEREPETTVDID